MTLLHIDSGITGKWSASRRLSAELVGRLTRAMPGLDVIRHDLDAEPVLRPDSRRLRRVWPANAPAAAAGIPDPEGARRIPRRRFQETYLRAVFAFIGIAEPEIVRAEGPALGSAQREAAMRAASAAVPAAVTGLAA